MRYEFLWIVQTTGCDYEIHQQGEGYYYFHIFGNDWEEGFDTLFEATHYMFECIKDHSEKILDETIMDYRNEGAE